MSDAKVGVDTKVKTKGRNWVEVDLGEWLGLDEAEMKVIDFRVALVKAIRRGREGSNVSQAALAERVGTSQPNIAKIEAGGVGVSLDLLLRVFFATGGSLDDLAVGVGSRQRDAPGVT